MTADKATKGRVVMGLLFFPRGGSAQVARYLAPCLSDAGWTVSLVTGSLGVAGVKGFGLGSGLFKPGLTADEVAVRAKAYVAAWNALN